MIIVAIYIYNIYYVQVESGIEKGMVKAYFLYIIRIILCSELYLQFLEI